jgi:hypothetical protein
MPNEALENLMLDAIGLELATIGQPPTSNWLTTTPPAIKVGVPGDKIRGPNLMTLYLQHVASGLGSDSVGVNQHRLDATFNIWCCSSHAADGQRRALNLKEDVLRALLAAERTFYALFRYGLEVGPFTFSGDEMFTRAGITAGLQEIRIGADLQHAQEMGVSHPFEFPFPSGSGRLKSGTPISPLFGPLTNGARQVIFSQPPGTSGIIRNLAFITNQITAGGSPTIPDLTFEIKYDGAATASVSIPLLTLLAMEYPEGSIADVFASNQIFEITTALFKASAPTTPGAIAGSFRLPIPYTNGIEISVVAPASTDKCTIFANVLYQDSLPSAWNSNLRFFADRSNASVTARVDSSIALKMTDPTHAEATLGTFPSDIVGKSVLLVSLANTDMLVLERTDSTHVVVSAKDTVGVILNTVESDIIHATMHPFLSRPAGEAGWIAGIVAAFNADPYFFEGNPRLFLDGATEADLTWTSVEDFAHGAFYFDQKRQGDEGGVISSHSDGLRWSTYKSFYKSPVRYANGVVGKVPNFAAQPTPATLRWTTFYYKEI